MMRRPLDRRMFINPQQRRNMARMPQGILASGPRIMNAAMQQQEPIRMQQGGATDTRLRPGSILDRIFNPIPLGQRQPDPRYTGSLGSSAVPSMIPGQGSMSGRRVNSAMGMPDESVAPAPAPGTGLGSGTSAAAPGAAAGSVPSGDMPGSSDIPSNQPGDVNFEPEVPGIPPGDIATDVTQQFDDTLSGALSGAPQKKGGEDKEGDTGLLSLISELDKLGNKEDLTTDQYIEKSAAMLKAAGITEPDLDARRKDRILQFFLEMAAGQSPDALTNVTQAAKSAGMGFAEDRRDVEKATRDFKLATVQMGLSEQARDEASAQAILLKKYDLSADVIKELNKDTKLNQIRGLMGLGVSEEDAIGYVFKGKDPSVFMEKFQRYKGMGTGDAFATFLASSTQGILETLRDSPALAERIANGIIAEKGADALTKTDKELLGLDPDFGVKERVDP